MRTKIMQALRQDEALAILGLVVIVSGDADSITTRPFMNLRWGDTVPGLGPVVRRNLVLWVHDEPHDYSRIDAVIARVRRILTDLVALPAGAGWLVGVEWVTDSSDLFNDQRRTILRTSTYQVIGSGM